VVEVHYAKADQDDILMAIQVTNAGAAPATLHVLPTVWFRNTWSWDTGRPRPVVAATASPPAGATAVRIRHPYGTELELIAGAGPAGTLPRLLFCENETNTARLFGAAPATPYPKDGINDHVISGAATVNLGLLGTKCTFWYQVTVAPGDTAELRLRLRPAVSPAAADPASMARTRPARSRWWLARPSGRRLTLDRIAADLQDRLISLFVPGPDGRRPCFGGVSRLQDDPAWRDNVVFSEYFHGDNGAGLGASHQTGWTGLIADVIRRRHGAVPSTADLLADLAAALPPAQ
jgi:hypothetical protein